MVKSPSITSGNRTNNAFGNNKTKDAVAKIFKALIVVRAEASVGQCLGQQRLVLELIAEP